MSKREAGMLTDWGRYWWAHVWSGTDAAKRTEARDALIKLVNGQLNDIGFKLGRGWQDYDPVIRAKGRRPSSYIAIAGWAWRQPDKGRDAARQFYNWATGDTILLTDLPHQLLDLAIITHLAESARGYHKSNDNGLYPLMDEIANGTKGWGDIKEYSPALTYKEDMVDWYDD
ncbi:hypothetical protein [Paraburkholderia tagetis]|uniref:Uncharacterized protein n=1 Tax=Paraburkholderia tagetis TaxID=2913261 RepID=A0A9X1UKN7_9BURK|nr:hypothetical protein [Paraburkholderia tagetis]MCG5075086.1 hypothetical protein [Paraburkholderia tagetis]